MSAGSEGVSNAERSCIAILKYEEAQAWKERSISLSLQGTALSASQHGEDRLRGMAKVEGTMNGHPFRAALEPNTSGSHWLRVNKAMREGAGADAGDMVKLVILGPEPEPTVPADLRVALTASHEAKTLWKDLTPIGRRDWIRWIESAKKPETRARRITRSVEQLSSGKRRPCCMNIYEFMTRRIPTNVSRPKSLGC